MHLAVVIPAYNEEKTISRVIKAAQACQEVSEIVVVSDGSTDQTAEIARSLGVKVIDLPSNMGKGAAVVAGIEAITSEIVALLDADLLGISPYHIKALYDPVKRGVADMTVGVFESGRLITDLSQRLTPFLNGQRALRKEVFEALCHLEITRYGVDITLSRYAKNAKLRVMKVKLKNITQRMKEEKLGLVHGVIARIKMFWEVIMALGFKLPPQ